MAFVDTLPATMTSSMHHDLDTGNRLEVAWLGGDVVARGGQVALSWDEDAVGHYRVG